MVEYLPVGPKEAPQTIFGKKNISGLKSLTPYPSPLCSAPSTQTPAQDRLERGRQFQQTQQIHALPQGSRAASLTPILALIPEGTPTPAAVQTQTQHRHR